MCLLQFEGQSGPESTPAGKIQGDKRRTGRYFSSRGILKLNWDWPSQFGQEARESFMWASCGSTI